MTRKINKTKFGVAKRGNDNGKILHPHWPTHIKCMKCFIKLIQQKFDGYELMSCSPGPRTRLVCLKCQGRKQL